MMDLMGENNSESCSQQLISSIASSHIETVVIEAINVFIYHEANLWGTESGSGITNLDAFFA